VGICSHFKLNSLRGALRVFRLIAGRLACFSRVFRVFSRGFARFSCVFARFRDESVGAVQFLSD
jgi:hypothetical protein